MLLETKLTHYTSFYASENKRLRSISYYNRLFFTKNTNQSNHNFKYNKQTNYTYQYMGQSILHNTLTNMEAAIYSRDIDGTAKIKNVSHNQKLLAKS
jgi:hypothetical protein